MSYKERMQEQDPTELLDFASLLCSEGVTRYLEIGSREGRSLWRVAQMLPKGSTIVSVDLPGGDGQQHAVGELAICIRDLTESGYLAHAFLADSKDPATLAGVKRFAPFDAVFIDGDHTASGVWSDWETYGKLAPIVAFHDIACRGDTVKVWEKWLKHRSYGLHIGPFPRNHRVWQYFDDEKICAVPYLWDELKLAYRHREFSQHRDKFGIGVLWR